MENLSLKEQGRETKKHLEIFLKNQSYLYKYYFAENLAKLGTFIFVSFLVSIMALFLLALLSISLAIFLGEIIGNTGLAFLLVSLLYFLIGLGIFLGRKKLFRNPLLRSIINEINNA